MFFVWITARMDGLNRPGESHSREEMGLNLTGYYDVLATNMGRSCTAMLKAVNHAD